MKYGVSASVFLTKQGWKIRAVTIVGKDFFIARSGGFGMVLGASAAGLLKR
jgi:hypothetical protein